MTNTIEYNGTTYNTENSTDMADLSQARMDAKDKANKAYKELQSGVVEHDRKLSSGGYTTVRAHVRKRTTKK